MKDDNETRGAGDKGAEDCQTAESRAGGLRLQCADVGPGLRWFVKRGAKTWFERGFRTKARAGAWIDEHGEEVEWRAGYVFRMKGDSVDVQIVDRRGRSALVGRGARHLKWPEGGVHD